MRGAEHETPHGETPYSPTSLLRALTANPYGVSTLRAHEHPAAEATPPARLEQEVRDTRAETERLEGRRAELEGEIAEAQGVVLGQSESGAAERLAAYEQAGGGAALSGPGTELVLEDSAPLPAS